MSTNDLSPRRSWVIAFAAAIACLAATPAARAQLNFDPPEPPAQVQSESTLIDSLDGRVRSLADREPHVLEHAVLDLARRTMIAARSLGAAGSSHAITARRLLASQRQVQSIDTLAATDLGVQLARDRCARLLAGQVPPDIAMLDAMIHDALAPLVQLSNDSGFDPRVAGWIDQEPSAASSLAALVASWSAAVTLSGARVAITLETRDAIGTFASDVDEALGWSAHANTAAEHLRLLERAGRVTGALPSWVSVRIHEALAQQFDADLRLYADPESRSDARARLATLAHGLEMLLTMDAMSARYRGIDQAQTELLSAVRAAPARPEAGALSLANFERAVQLLAERESIGEEADILRQLRPAWRALDDRAKKTGSDLLPHFAAMAGDSDSMSQPSVVAAIAAHRRSLDDLHAMMAINTRLDPQGTQRISDALERIASTRILELGKSLSRGDLKEREDALAEVRSFGRALVELDPVSGESLLRSQTQALGPILAGRAQEVIDHIDAVRSTWFAAWAQTRNDIAQQELADTALAELRLCAAIVGAAADVVRLDQIGSAPGIASWPGFWISDEARKALARGAQETISRATAQMLGDDHQRATRTMRNFQVEFAPLIALARLDRLAVQRSLRNITALDALASTPSQSISRNGQPWLFDQRDAIASLCRYSEELVRHRSPALDEYLRMIAGSLIEDTEQPQRTAAGSQGSGTVGPGG